MNAPWPYWCELAVILGIFAVGNVLLGHFEEHTPKWRRVGKIVVVSALAVLVSAAFGRGGFFGLLGLGTAAVLVIHGWWLPRQGINGWTAAPREKYYALRGWKLEP